MAHPRPGLVVATTLAILLTSGCTRGDATEPGVTRADSAGVRLITSTAADTMLPWQFEELDVLRDSAGEPYLFARLWSRGVITDRAGRTYVLTRDPAILMFGRDGRLQRTIGRNGEGPGEMRLPAAMAVEGDTIIVLDLMKRALVRWDPGFEPLGDRRLEGALARADGIAFRTGGFWFQRVEFTPQAMVTSFFGDTAQPPLHTVSAPSGGPVDLGCVRLSRSQNLFLPYLTWSASGPRVLVNVGPGYDLWLHEGSRPVARVSRAVEARAPTIEDVREEYPEGYQVRFGGDLPPCVTPPEKVMEAFGVAPVYPAVHELALLSDGTMWVQRNPRAAAEPRVDVFTSTGAYAGTMRGRHLPLGRMPNGELLIPRLDEDSGGWVLGRVRVRQ